MITTAHFTDRVEQARQLVASRDHTPALADADRELLGDTLRSLRRVIGDCGAAEQLLLSVQRRPVANPRLGETTASGTKNAAPP
jgi:hypothetical protein